MDHLMAQEMVFRPWYRSFSMILRCKFSSNILAQPSVVLCMICCLYFTDSLLEMMLVLFSVSKEIGVGPTFADAPNQGIWTILSEHSPFRVRWVNGVLFYTSNLELNYGGKTIMSYDSSCSSARSSYMRFSTILRYLFLEQSVYLCNDFCAEISDHSFITLLRFGFNTDIAFPRFKPWNSTIWTPCLWAM